MGRKENNVYFVKRTATLCDMLQDDLTRRIFWSRVKFDVEPSIQNGLEMARTWNNGGVEQPMDSAACGEYPEL